MNKKSGTIKTSATKLVKYIHRKTRPTYSSEEQIRIVLAGLRGEETISALCRREGISEGLYYSWSKEFLEAGKRRLSGDTARQATSPEVKDLRSEEMAQRAETGHPPVQSDKPKQAFDEPGRVSRRHSEQDFHGQAGSGSRHR